MTHEGNTYSVTSIGTDAFYGCSGLTEVTISGSVTYIGESAFWSCTGLTEVTIPGSVTYIGDFAFVACFGLTEVTIPGSVTYIGVQAFAFCSGLTEVTIPNSVTYIGEHAFYGCSGLTEVTIPGSVTYIGLSPFSECSSLEKITVESGNPNYDSRENCNAIIETNSNELIAGCKNTIIPSSVTSIGKLAFYGCSGLTEVTIPNSVTSIGAWAFQDCSGLTSVTIPNSVTTIDGGAFYQCNGLTEVTIGNSVTSIGNQAFYRCSGLTTLYSLNTTPPSVANTFEGYHYTTVDLFVPAEALEAYQIAEVWQEFEKLQAIDGTATAIAKVSAAEQIHSANGQITVTGLTDGTTVAVYDLNGKQVGTARSKGGQVSISTGMTAGAAAVVKIGDKSVKTVMK